MRFGSPFSSKIVVCGHYLVTLPLTMNQNIKTALIAAHLNAELILVVTLSIAYSSLSLHLLGTRSPPVLLCVEITRH